MPDLTKSKSLREERARLAERMKEIKAKADADNGGKGRVLNAEERAEWDRIHNEQNALLERIKDAEAVESIDADLERSAGRLAGGKDSRGTDEPPSSTGDPEKEPDTPEQKTLKLAEYRAFMTWMRGGTRRLTAEQLAIMERRSAAGDEVVQKRAQSVGVDTAGGYLVPDQFSAQVIEALLNFGGMRASRATIIPTSQGGTLLIPTDDDTSNEGEIIGENIEHNEQDVSFKQVALNDYLYSSKIVKVSRQLLNDLMFPIAPFLARKLAQRLGRITNRHFTTGDGASKPEGVVTGATTGVSGATGQSTSVTSNDLVALEHSVDRDYRVAAEWMFHDSTLKALKQMKDGEGRPLWLPGLAVKEPDTILGYQFVVNNHMAEMAASAKSILFGDFSLYYIRDVQGGLILLRLEERYAEKLQVAFLAFSRHDGKLVDAGTRPIKAYVNSAS